MKPNIVIRADGGTLIGMGHVIRCLAMADMLKDDFNIIFAIQEPSPNVINNIKTITSDIITLPLNSDFIGEVKHLTKIVPSDSIIVLDGYNFKSEYQFILKSSGYKVVAIDDLNEWHQYVDSVINHAEGIDASLYSKEKYTKMYLGLDYVLLRKEFLQCGLKITPKNTISKVFISMGAADAGNITEKFARALSSMNSTTEIHLMIGTANPHRDALKKLTSEGIRSKIVIHLNLVSPELMQLLQYCDISICPASSIALESCAVGIGLVTGYTAKNQLGILDGLLQYNAAINLGDLNTISTEEIQTRLSEMNAGMVNKMLENQRQMIDGQSPRRIVEIFKNLAV